MKKRNRGISPFLIIECIAIVALLVLIVNLLKSDSTAASAEEVLTTESSIVEETVVPTEVATVEATSEPAATEPATTVENAVSGNDLTGDGQTIIVVFGDSNWEDDGETNEVSTQLASLCNATVYNCALGGTTAALNNEDHEIEKWDSRSLCGMIYMATGKQDIDTQLEGYDKVKEVMHQIDFTKVDYFIFSYGLNDYFGGIQIYPEDLFDMTTYVGALRYSCTMIKENFPKAKTLVIAPTYCQFLSNGTVTGDSNTVNLGKGILPDYVAAAKDVAENYGAMYFDAYNEVGINSDNASEYLKDGVHFTEAGRTIYANLVATYILNSENGQ